jgi:hypothetical protein
MKDTSGMTDAFKESNLNNVDSSKQTTFKYGFSKEDQLKMANEYINKPLNVGDKWYLVNAEWYNKWAKFIGLDSKGSQIKPDSVDNKCLFKPDSKVLKEGIQEDVDYFTICEELWNYIVKIYGVAQAEVGFCMIL